MALKQLLEAVRRELEAEDAQHASQKVGQRDAFLDAIKAQYQAKREIRSLIEAAEREYRDA